MQEQDFEKLVQKTLEPFSLTPSTAVWQGVEAAIAPERRKRRVVLWVLFLGFVAGAGWWAMNNSESKTETAVNKNIPISTAAKSSTKPTLSLKKNDRLNRDKNDVVLEHTKNINHQAVAGKAGIGSNTTAQETTGIKRNGDTHAAVVWNENNHANSLIYNQHNAVNFDKAMPRTATPAANKVPRTIIQKAWLMNLQKPVFEIPEPKSLRLRNVDSVSAHFKDVVRHKRKSFLSFSLQSGLAGLYNKGLLSAAKAAFDNSASPVVSLSQMRNNTTVVNPATPLPGIYVEAGAYWNKPLQKRFTLIAGLQYGWYTQRMRTGSQLQQQTLLLSSGADMLSSSEAVFTPGSAGDFINQYHVVSIPVQLRWQAGRRLPLRLQGGVSPGFIVAAKSLQYDAASKLYYQSNEGLRRLQLAAMAEADYRIGKSKKYLFYIGPRAGYQLSTLRRKASFNNGHLFQYGIGWSMESKK